MHPVRYNICHIIYSRCVAKVYGSTCAACKAHDHEYGYYQPLRTNISVGG